MAIAYVKDSGELFADNASSIAPSLGSVVAGNNVIMLVASAANNTQDNFSPPSGWTDAVSPAGASGNTWNSAIAIFYKENSSGGTESGTVTLASGSYAAATICEVSGVLTTASLDTTDSSIVSTQVDTSGTTGSGVTNSQAASIVFAGLTASTGGSTSGLSRSTSGYTTIYSEAADSTHIAYSFDYQIVSSSASRSVTYTWTGGSNHSGVLAIFKEGGSTPSFITQPQSQSASSGGTATFNCTTTGATSYQWQSAPITSLYSNCPGTWSDIGSATTEDYTTPTLGSSDNGKWYRLKATNASGDTYSHPVRAWIIGLPVTGKGFEGRTGWFRKSKGLGRRTQNLSLRQTVSPVSSPSSLPHIVWSDWWWGASTGGVSVTGQTITEQFSIVAGSATAGASASGTTVTQTTEMIPGAVTVGTNVNVGGATIEQVESLIAGETTGGSSISGATVTEQTEMVAGAVSGAAVVSGVMATEQVAMIAGNATGSAAVQGSISTLETSSIAGAVTVNVAASGATIEQQASILAGTASGSAVVGGDLVSLETSLIPGSVSVGGGINVDGAVLDCLYGIVSGTAAASGVDAFSAGVPAARGRRSKLYAEPPTPEQIEAERIRLGIIEAKAEKKAVLQRAAQVANGSPTRQELRTYAYLLREEIAAREAEYAIMKSKLLARGDRIRTSAITALARQQIEYEAEVAMIEERDIAFVMAMMIEL